MVWNKKILKSDKFKNDFFLRLTKVNHRISVAAGENKRPETDLEVQRRFAKLRLARAKEQYGPVRTNDNELTYGDVKDEITDEEIEYYTLGTTDPKLKAAIISNPKNEHKVKRCEEWKRERDSKTKEEKREGTQRVHCYNLIYDDDTPEQDRH
jgi:hypothetical protein